MNDIKYILHPEDNIRFILIPSYIPSVLSLDGINWYIPNENGWAKTSYKIDKTKNMTVEEYINKYCSIYLTSNKGAFVIVYNYLTNIH